MANDIELIVLPSTITNTCWDSQQQMVNAIAASIRVLIPGTLGFYVTGPNEPTVEQRAHEWHKTDASTNAMVGVYRWSPIYGAWVRNHWEVNGGGAPTNERRLFMGSLTDLETYDGGEAGVVTDTTGPFWENDTAWTNLTPIGVGTLIATVGNSLAVFDDATPGDPKLRAVYFIKPTGRIYDRGN